MKFADIYRLNGWSNNLVVYLLNKRFGFQLVIQQKSGYRSSWLTQRWQISKNRNLISINITHDQKDYNRITSKRLPLCPQIFDPSLLHSNYYLKVEYIITIFINLNCGLSYSIFKGTWISRSNFYDAGHKIIRLPPTSFQF